MSPSDSTYVLPEPPLISSDIDLGTVQYGDPFPATWPRIFSFCQQATVPLPNVDPNYTSTYNVTNRQLIALPSAPITPLISPALNPTINGASLFTSATLSNKAVTVSWDKPATGTPYGYTVKLMTPLTAESLDGSTSETLYAVVAALNTAKTSVAIPPTYLTAGNTYYITITAQVDGKANMETSP
jgi:hypothetical protein